MEPLMDERVVSRGVCGIGPKERRQILQHGMVGIVVVGELKFVKTAQQVLAAHLVQQHPHHPTHLVVGHGRVARLRPVDLDHRLFGVDLAGIAVALFDPLAELDARGEPLHLLDKKDRGEVRHPFGEQIAAGTLAGEHHVPPPLVGGLVRGDRERRVSRFFLARQESDAFGERDVGGKPLRVG